ncbi:T9SS type A sorting domain-containing protein [Candidatus Pacearchaeota archaeon]|nr:T9SS type A sorting domain-containing protein [Candidatus Pacearchaeota archaeon]
MANLRKKVITGLTGILLAAATIFPSKAQERVIIDNFSQPNDTTLNYYGSGDVLLDKTIDWKDALRLDSLIQGTFTDYSDDRLLDRADINGDEVINSQDKEILEEKLNNLRDYLPSNWNKSDPLEKEEWFEKMVVIDKTDEINSIDCKDFSNPFRINFHGFKSLENVDPNEFKYEFSKNNRFNIPVYSVSATTTSGTPHAFSSVLIGENPFSFNDWYFIEVGDLSTPDRKVFPGDWDMALGEDVEIDYLWNMNPETAGGSISKIIRWYLDENGNANLIEAEPYLIPSNPNKDKISPEINLSISDSSYYNSNVSLEYLVKENQTFLDSTYYELNGNKKNIECSVPYYSGFIGTDSISGTESLTLPEGEYNLVFFANDIAKPQGNKTIEKRTFFVDKTAPKINITYPQEQNYVGSVDSLVFSIFDENLDSCAYSIDNGETKTCFPSQSSGQNTIELSGLEGANTWSIYTKDKAGNFSKEEVNFNIIPDAVEKEVVEDYFKAYPNPTTGNLNFEFYLDAPKDLKFSVHSITGKRLEERIIKGNQGDNKATSDFSEYSSGLYIYRFEGLDKGDVKTGKVVKQ